MNTWEKEKINSKHNKSKRTNENTKLCTILGILFRYKAYLFLSVRMSVNIFQQLDESVSFISTSILCIRKKIFSPRNIWF